MREPAVFHRPDSARISRPYSSAYDMIHQAWRWVALAVCIDVVWLGVQLVR